MAPPFVMSLIYLFIFCLLLLCELSSFLPWPFHLSFSLTCRNLFRVFLGFVVFDLLAVSNFAPVRFPISTTFQFDLLN